MREHERLRSERRAVSVAQVWPSHAPYDAQVYERRILTKLRAVAVRPRRRGGLHRHHRWGRTWDAGPRQPRSLASSLLILVIGIHKPLSVVSESSLKFVVDLMLSTFGIFWVGEDLGAEWPCADLSRFRSSAFSRRSLSSPSGCITGRYVVVAALNLRRDLREQMPDPPRTQLKSPL